MSTDNNQRPRPVFDTPLSDWDERDRANGITYQGRDYGRLLKAINNKQIPHAWDNQYYLNADIAKAFLDDFYPTIPTQTAAPAPAIDVNELLVALKRLLSEVSGTN